MSGLFITFEGGEGAGKSTQIARLASYLRENGAQVVVTREPGGSKLAETLRELLISGQARAGGASVEALLFAAARADHVAEVIKPALARDCIVLCDRFFDSTRAYQGAAGGVGDEALSALEGIACGSLRPDITFLLDLAPEKGLARAAKRNQADRFEEEALAFHHAVRMGFLRIAEREPQRVRVIDAERGVDEIFADIVAELEAHRSRSHG